MKTRVFRLVVLAVMLLGASSAMAAITGSKHDLSATGGGTIKANAGQSNDEICVYCHTPHGANTGFVGAPLWNKAADYSGNPFKMYGASSTNTAGTTLAGSSTDVQPNNPSKACLSCHDGVNAINSMVNAPGSGGYNPSGASVAFGGTAAGSDKTMPSGITQIGTDLTNDHPISITYNAGKASLKATTETLIDTWTTPSGGNTIADLLRSNKVECSSCHDPHLGENDTFLRRTKGAGFSNEGSKVCLSCHAK